MWEMGSYLRNGNKWGSSGVRCLCYKQFFPFSLDVSGEHALRGPAIWPIDSGQAAFWREARDHPLLSSPLTRWGLFSNCNFISNYCLHTDAVSHRNGKYTMSQIITQGCARVGLSWKQEEPPVPTVLLLYGAAAGSKVLGLPHL